MTGIQGSPPRGGSGPRVTVVVRAFRHRLFLRAALDSVERQNLPPGAVETIVLTPPPSEAWEAELRGRNVAHIVVTGSRQGNGIAAAARAARAPLIALLDDDDCFHPARLEEALAILESNPEVAYYRNALVPFRTEFEAETLFHNRPDQPPTRARTGLRRPPELDSSEVSRLFWAEWAYCSSTVIAQRGLFLAFPDALEELYVGTSMFLFWAAIALGRPIYLDRRALTLYRIHPDNVSGAGTVRDRSTWARWQQLAPTLVHEAGVIRSISSRLRPVDRWLRPIAAVEARNRLILSVDRAGGSRREVLRHLVSYVGAAPPHVLARQWAFLAVGSARLVSRGAATGALRFWFASADRNRAEGLADMFVGAPPLVP